MAVNDDKRSEDATIIGRYREAAMETPPRYLDDAIRQGARGSLRAAGPHRSTWWSGWRLPLVTAAVAIISASLVTILLEREETRRETDVPPSTNNSARAPPGVSVPASGSSMASAPAAREPDDERSMAPLQAKRQDPRSHGAPVLRAPPAPQPKVGPAADKASEGAERSVPFDSQESATRERRSSAAAQPSLPASQPQTESQVRSEHALPGSTGDRALPEFVPSPASPAPAVQADRRAFSSGPTASSTVSALVAELAQEPPRRWIERLASLRREGRREDANALLAEFRRRYPNEPVPENLSE